ncbi:hypothetical protein COMA1_11446 [Candidatus Nitrospira nitrosa]|uniref:Uncharacterized protein n=1 Tax=Candidatus Nitrospira nitrosa TaxID=1742972 RepID=A0A0S4LFT1_9BACT|nr:hypothetical protein COMA1_11446 [Candidatus Nitrospira nitrosa]
MYSQPSLRLAGESCTDANPLDMNKFLTTLTPSKDEYRGELHYDDGLKRSGYEKSSLNVIRVQPAGENWRAKTTAMLVK